MKGGTRARIGGLRVCAPVVAHEGLDQVHRPVRASSVADHIDCLHELAITFNELAVNFEHRLLAQIRACL